jgi:hypothetical protein
MKNLAFQFSSPLLKFAICISILNVKVNCLTGQTLKPRIIVTTDITNEPDDQQSLVRLLAYSNNYDIEGLIGSTGIWKLCDPATNVIRECIDAYGKVWKNLVLHDNEYPTSEYLQSITTTGNTGYGMSAVGFRGSRGANLIIEAADRDDPRPLWLLAWGGSNTIAQALWTVMHSRNEEEINNFVSKIRIYDLAGQDDAGAWMAKTFPDLFIIRNVLAYKGMSFRYSSTEWDHTRGGDESVVTRDWVKRNIQQDHGPLGMMYPDALHIWEGDTPTFFYLMQNGLNDPEQQWQGSWGGRFGREKSKNVNIEVQEYAGADCSKGCWVNEEPYLDYWLYSDASDTWAYKDNLYNNQWCTIFRWRTDFQNDFAARMDWCVRDYKNTNHNPVAFVNGDETKNVLYITALPGSSLKINTKGSYDPDGDELSYDWWIYKEASTFQGDVTIKKTSSKNPILEIPAESIGKTIHVVLTMRDDGNPQLTSYRRMVISCTDKGD